VPGPSDHLRAWLPHVLLLGLVVAVVGLLLVVVWPLRDPLLLAGAVALLTYPLVFLPILNRLRASAPHWPDDRNRFVAAALATSVVGVAGVLLLIGALWLALGRLEQVWDLLAGVLLGDGRRLDRAIDALVRKLSRIVDLYPQLPWDAKLVKASLREMLGRGAVGTDMLGFLFKGTIGVMATAAMTLIALFYLYAQGPHLVSQMLHWLPLTAERRAQLGERFRGLAVYVAAGVLARAALHGVVCGLIAWALAGANPIATGVVAGFLALLPVVGPAIAWLPFATVLWSSDQRIQAVCLAIACLSAAWVVELAFQRLARRLGADSLWFSFLLFCGLVGGVASFGLRGIIIGPAAALTAAALFGFLPAVYGVGHEDDAPR
jgi:predicted PurR-regulated permease PerM